MPNLVGIAGADPRLREEFIQRAKPRLMSFDWLAFDQKIFGKASLAWGADASATPISTCHSENGSFVFVMGELAAERQGQENNAQAVRRSLDSDGRQAVSGLNGYYLAVSGDPTGEMILGTDILGLVPLYYFSTPDTLIFSTSPALFNAFPEFSPQLNIRGLVGILLTSHLVGGETLWKGVRRLSAGHALRWKPGENAQEIKSRCLVPSDGYFGRPQSENIDTIDSILSTIMCEAANSNRGNKNTILFSGGLDTRCLAGYLRQAKGGPLCAVTLGDQCDIEMECAAKAARALGWHHEKIHIDLAELHGSILKQIELEQLANGFSPTWLYAAKSIRPLGSRIYAGFFGDAILGSEEYTTLEGGWDEFFAWGLGPDRLRRLFRPEVLGGHLDAVMDTLRGEFLSCPGELFQKEWLFNLLQYERCHIGSNPWSLSYGAWPVLPFADRRLLEAAAQMPEETLKNRRVQTDLVCSRFRDLAALPLDRNSFVTTPALRVREILSQPAPLSVSALALWEHFKARLRQPVRSAFFRLGGRERRYFYRLLDIHHEGWLRARKSADALFPETSALFDLKELRRILPAAGTKMELHDGIVGSSGLKSLLGFILLKRQTE